MNFLIDDPKWINELLEIKELIIKMNRSGEKFLDQSLDYIALTGGKMLRPTFVLIGGTFGEPSEDKKKLRTVATAVETLHLATLIHDDIIDESKLRRGHATIWSKYSKEYAVYMGDYLFSHTFLMMAEQEIKPQVLKEVSRGIAYICKGEMKQNAHRHQSDLSVRGYLDVIRGKTAFLFALSLSLGAYQSNATDSLNRMLFKIGLNTGMAFQIIDDILDYTGSKAEVGKEVGKDILKGYYSLPLILALKTDRREELNQILKKEVMNPEDTQLLIRIVNQSGGVNEAKEIAGKYTDKALKGILSLPNTEGRIIMEKLIPKLLNRRY